MASISPLTSSVPFNTAVVSELGGDQLAIGGGSLASVVVKVAGSDDCQATLYSGTSTSGQPLATFTLNAVGPVSLPNSSFDGLFIDVSGTAAGTVAITYSGQVP